MTLDVQPAVRICQRERAEAGAATLPCGIAPLDQPLINTPAPAASQSPALFSAQIPGVVLFLKGQSHSFVVR